MDLALRQGFEEEFTQNDQAHAYRETVYTLNASSKDPLGYRHQYRVFDLPDRDDVSPATNGHLHATGPVFRFSAGTAEVTLHPLMAVSSNVLRETRDFEFRDLQPHGKAAWQAPALADGQWRWGLQSDSRWGRMLAYPHVSWESAGEGPLQLSLGLPDSALVWTPARAWTVSMDVGPDGGEWRVRDAEFERTSTFRERRWRWAGSVTRTFGPHASLSGGVEYAFERRWEYTLENGETQQISPPNAPMLFAAVQVGF
ncbi:MAG: hypothetical protein JJU29_04520 [Verrucomicrobia bacterium]|nr:hypothetical protein [Verrucomicrobiota bacterium]MCH8510198.1 hypothetical protein [Kiritimatiellia bacterium]